MRMRYLIIFLLMSLFCSCSKPDSVKDTKNGGGHGVGFFYDFAPELEALKSNVTNNNDSVEEVSRYSLVYKVDSIRTVFKESVPIKDLGVRMNRMLEDFCGLDCETVFGQDAEAWIGGLRKGWNDTIVASVNKNLELCTSFLRLYNTSTAENIYIGGNVESPDFALSKEIRRIEDPIKMFWMDVVMWDGRKLTTSNIVNSTVIAFIKNGRITELRAADTKIELPEGEFFPLDSITNRKNTMMGSASGNRAPNTMEPQYRRGIGYYDDGIESIEHLPELVVKPDSSANASKR